MAIFCAVFPGQGAQKVGMGQEICREFSVARRAFEEASDSLGQNISELCFSGPAEALELTENTQPALLATSIATYRVLQSICPIDEKIKFVAGHSVGEYAALVVAGTLSFSDALRAVRLRGQLMQSAVPVGVGGMTAAVGGNPQLIENLCRALVDVFAQGNEAPLVVAPANFNCPGQIVLSGHKSALDRLNQWLSKEQVSGFSEVISQARAPNKLTADEIEAVKKLRLIPLKVSAPFHCSLMEPAEKALASHLKSLAFSRAEPPVLQNFTAQLHSEPEQLRDNLIAQVSGSVRWEQSLQYVLDKVYPTQTLHMIECGSGAVLKGLAKKISPERLQSFTTQNLTEVKAIEALSWS